MASMEPAELEAVMAQTGALIDELVKAEAFVFACGLHPPSSAVTVDATGDEERRTPGPFVEADEYLGGFWVIAAPDQDAAADWAAKASKALGSKIEVRALQEAPEAE